MIQDSARSAVPADAGRATPDVEVYDFRRSATLSRENARALEVAFETFSRQWSAQLSAKIRVRATVSVERVTMQTYGEYAQSLPPTTTMVVGALPDSAERIVVQFPSSAATAWIVQMVGGRPTGAADERTFTQIEQALVHSLMVEAIEHLTGALDGLLPSGVTIAGIQYNPQFAQVAATNEPVVVSTLLMRTGGRTVPMSVMLPASVLAGFSTRPSESDRASAPERIRAQVDLAPVEVSLRATPRIVHPREVLDLSVGDIVPLPHSADRPLDLVIGEQTIATAAVGTAGARLACVITAIVPDSAPSEEHA